MVTRPTRAPYQYCNYYYYYVPGGTTLTDRQGRHAKNAVKVPNRAIYSRNMAFGRWVLGPFLSERNILSLTSVGRGHIFNEVSDVTFVFLVKLYNNDISAN